MAINVSVQYNGGSLPDIILLTQGYYHWGTHLNAVKRLHIFSNGTTFYTCSRKFLRTCCKT